MDGGRETDELVAVLPIHFANTLAPDVHLHQFPLLNRQLQIPPSAQLSGKRISARVKPEIRRIELHIPADTRPEVWNSDRAGDLGAAQIDDDAEKKQDGKKLKEGEDPRLSEIRLQSEQIPQRGCRMLGIVRNGKLNLHPINEIHQFRPTLTYLDILSHRNRRLHQAGSDFESDSGPPPDPDEPIPAEIPKKEKATETGKEVQVSARKTDDKGGVSVQGGLSAVRRDMLRVIRAEEDEEWTDLLFFDVTTKESAEALETVFSQSTDILATNDDTSFPKEQLSSSATRRFSLQPVFDTLHQHLPWPTPMSDTESEYEHGTRESNFFDDPAIEVATYPDTVQTREGDRSHTTELSTAILDCVDSALQCGDREQALHVFRLLMNQQTLDLFLQLRCEARKQKDISFTWVDGILSKLGTLVLSVISDDYQGNSTYRDTLRNQVERDAIRAASQLPGKSDCWEVLPSALNAQHLSPAAKRLIIRLQFGVLVMQPELSGTRVEYSGREIQVVLNALETSAKDYVQFDPLTGIPVISKDAVDCAFFLALYTTLNTIQQEASSRSEELVAHTPYIETHLLALTDFVLHHESSKSATASVLPAICFHWGKLVPWCWAARADHRLANAEIVVIATTHWLQTMGCHGICTCHRQCKLATIHITEHPIRGCVALSNVLVQNVGQLVEHGGGCNNSLIRLLDKSCFFLSLVFRELSLKDNGESYERLKPHISRIGWSVLQLCVIRPGLGPRGVLSPIETEYLKMLLTIDGATIHQCLMELQRDHHLQFSSKVDHVLSEAKAQFLDEELLSSLQVSMVCFALGFLTVICSSGTRGIILRENASSLFTRLFNHLVVCTHRIQYGEALLGPSVTALIVAVKYFRPSRPLDSLVRNEGIWRLCLRAQWGRGSTASLALAQYVIHGDYPQKWPLILETLDHFRGLIFATIRRQVSQNLGRLSQIACPTFCLAMVRLLVGTEDVEARVARRFFISSPWTKELLVELNKFRLSISTSVGSDPCHDHTRQTLADTITLLIQVLSDSTGLSISMSAIGIPKFDIRLCFEESEVVIAIGDAIVE